MSTKRLKKGLLEIRIRRRRRVRRLALSVAADGQLTLTAGRSVPLSVIEEFVVRSLAWIEATLRRLGWTAETLANAEMRRVDDFRQYRHEAKRVITERLEELNRQYAFPYCGVSVRNQRSRWGSCSEKGHLSFNFRLLFLPIQLRDYVIVHELCHVRELNHSRRFWALVAETIPDYEARRRELRRHSLLDRPRA